MNTAVPFTPVTTARKDFDKEKPVSDSENGQFERTSSKYGVDRVPTMALYDGERVNLIPMPSDDPQGERERSVTRRNCEALMIFPDHLNLPEWRKWCAILALCFCRSPSNLECLINY